MAAASSNNTANGCLAIGAVGGLLLLVSMCSASKDKTIQSFSSPTLSNQVESMALPAPAPISPFNDASARKGGGYLKPVMAAEGLSGAMIFSQNCYDALVRSFNWAKLDQCGGFDMVAVKTAEGADTDTLTSEVEYFGSEAAAGRYLAVAIKAGQPESDADARLELLRKHVSGIRLTEPKPVSSGDGEEAIPDGDEPSPTNEMEQADV